MDKLPSGCEPLDILLDGGFETDIVSTIYGPAGAGKTTACLLASISAASMGKKVVYVDTEGGLSASRLSQLAGGKEITANLHFLSPTTFEQQKKCIESLRSMVNSKIGLVIVDTITSLYRTERSTDNSELNRELARQVGALVEIARSKSVPVLLTNQVYADFEDKKSVRMVGGDIITYNSKCLIEIKPFHLGKREAILKKHRHLPEREVFFEIQPSGFMLVKDKGFRLF